MYKLTNNLNDKKRIEKNNNKIIKIVEINEKDFENVTNINPPKEEKNLYWKYINYKMLDINLLTLKKENSDAVGWIQLNNTNINYPIVQTNNNEFYLTHQFDKTYNTAGWIYMDYRNDKILYNNYNSIIYGHGLKNKTLFGTLNNTLYEDWHNNEDNYIIKIIDEKYTYLWQIFSLYKIPTTDDYLQTKFIDENHYLSFLNMLKERSIKDFNTSINFDDKIITLQTCFNNEVKTVVHAKLIKYAEL